MRTIQKSGSRYNFRGEEGGGRIISGRVCIQILGPAVRDDEKNVTYIRVTKPKVHVLGRLIVRILVYRADSLTLLAFDRLRLHPSAKHAPSAPHSRIVSSSIVVPLRDPRASRLSSSPVQKEERMERVPLPLLRCTPCYPPFSRACPPFESRCVQLVFNARFNCNAELF